jgi:hypothetical protein
MSKSGLCAMICFALLAGEAPLVAQPKPAAATGPQPLARDQFIREIDGEFRKMDADKNGQLTKIEIEQYQKLQAVADARARNQALFAQLDTDRNGQLSPAEFTKVVGPPPAANAGPMLSREDGNRDQQISLVEHRAATLANFDRIDTDKDGIVTPVEMKAGGITPR